MEKLKHRIAIVIPYFGQWPDWFEYFLESCRYNTSINWFFFTDCRIPDIDEDHMRFQHFTLDNFNELASRKTAVSIDIKHPYKLCDLRPAFGDIFADYLTGFDFWGYGDIDLIYGDFRRFFTDNILEDYDILSNHDEFISGHLCILRNSPVTVSLYKKDDLYKKAFCDPFYTGFDEQIRRRKFDPDSTGLHPRIKSHLKQHIKKVATNSFISPLVPAWLKSLRRSLKGAEIRDFTSIVRHYSDPEGIRVFQRRTFQSDLMLKKLGVKRWEITWNKGQLVSSYGQEDILYFHFILSKLSEYFTYEGFEPGTDIFSINNSGIKRRSE